ncbi:hypothetical protein JCM16814_18690 [Desulfobaculum senezii]
MGLCLPSVIPFREKGRETAEARDGGTVWCGKRWRHMRRHGLGEDGGVPLRGIRWRCDKGLRSAATAAFMPFMEAAFFFLRLWLRGAIYKGSRRDMADLLWPSSRGCRCA